MSSSRFYTDAIVENLGTLDAAEANAIQFNPGQMVKVKRLIFVTIEAQTTADAVITVTLNNRDDTPTATLGTVTLPFTGSATDDVQYTEFGYPDDDGTAGVDGSTVYSSVSPGGLIEMVPGQELVMTTNAGGDAGIYQVYVEYIPEGFNPEVLGITDNELVFTHA